MNRIWSVAAILLFTACKNETVTKPIPVISVDAPANNQHFVMGDTIHISGNVTHSMPLTEVAVHMTDASSSNEFFHNHFGALYTSNYHFYSFYRITSNTSTSFEVEIEAIGEDGSSSTKKMTVTVN